MQDKSRREERPKKRRAHANAAARLRKLGHTSSGAARKWVDGMTEYATDYVDLAADTLEGSTSVSEFVRGAAALWIEAGGAACDFYHDLWASCSAPRIPGSDGKPGMVYFELDPRSQAANPLPLGNVRAADFKDLKKSDLVRVPAGNPIPEANVRLSTSGGDVFVELIHLKGITLNVDDFFQGTVTRISDGSLVSLVFVKVVEELE